MKINLPLMKMAMVYPAYNGIADLALTL